MSDSDPGNSIKEAILDLTDHQAESDKKKESVEGFFDAISKNRETATQLLEKERVEAIYGIACQIIEALKTKDNLRVSQIIRKAGRDGYKSSELKKMCEQLISR